MTSGYIQCFCLYLNQQTAASNAWTLPVCTCGAHTNTTSILSYSFSHSVELPLGFTGVVFIFTSPMWNFYSEQFRYSTHYISVYQCKRSACTLLWIFWWFSEIMYFYVFVCFGVFLFFNLLLSKAAYVYDFVYKSNTCLSPFTKGMVNYFLKKLPVPKNNLAAPWLASLMQPLGKLSD